MGQGGEKKRGQRMTLEDEKMSKGTGSLRLQSRRQRKGHGFHTGRSQFIHLLWADSDSRRFPVAVRRLPDKKQLSEETCSPSYSSSLWGSQEGNLKPLAVYYPQSRTESNECVHARLLACLCLAQFLCSSHNLSSLPRKWSHP